VGITAFDEHTPNGFSFLFNAGNTPLGQTISGPQPFGGRVDFIFITNSGAGDHPIEITYQPTGYDPALLLTAIVPAGAGVDPLVPTLNVLPLIASTLDGITLSPNDHLVVTCNDTLTGGDAIGVSIIGGGF